MAKTKAITFAAMALAGMILAGCAEGPKPLYHYGSYSDAYYAFKKEPGEKSMGEFKSSIEKLIGESDAKGLRVPPGMFANLGYIHLKMNNPQQAVENFEKEKALYPEARHFMDRMIEKTELSLKEKGSGHE